jgi:hypothetical protein
MRFKTFKHPIKAATVIKNLACLYGFIDTEKLNEISDEQLIKHWQYHCLANAMVRYPTFFFKPSTNEKIFIHQVGGEDYRQKMITILKSRNLLEKADKSFSINLTAIHNLVTK